MSQPLPNIRSHVTLALCTVLHAFTHAYGTLLVPLYLMMSDDLNLKGEKYATLIVTVYGGVYCVFSYLAGILADKFDRKVLLGIGLIGNAIAITLMGLTRQYEVLIALAVLAGLCGTLFHPAASALVPAHYPKSPGMAIGLLGIGSGIGFFAGPQYAGWRAENAKWQFGSIADWQRPCIEMGLAGIVFGVLFLLIAREVHKTQRHTPTKMDRPLRNRVLAIAAVLGCRDFAGIAMISLTSIFLQKAHGLSVKQTGFVVGAMMLSSVIANPIAVWLSPGRRRLPTLLAALILGAITLATTPFLPIVWVLPTLCLFEAFQLGTYAVSDAAMLERVSPAVRGQLIGLFLTLAGTFASTGPWLMGWWTDRLGQRSHDPLAYVAPYTTLAALMGFAALSIPLIARMGKPSMTPIDPLTQISPATMETVG